jgi:hypothetical protein
MDGREGVMKIFQICYEGDLTLEVATAVRRLKGEPNFDNSWEVQLDRDRSSAVLARYLSRSFAASGHLIVGETNPSRSREYLLIRHSTTPGFDYTPLRHAVSRLGFVHELPLTSTYLVRTSDRTQAHLLGDRLEELCPYDSLMVTGISPDLTIQAAGLAYRPSMSARRNEVTEERVRPSAEVRARG